MKRILYLWLASALVACGTASLACAQAGDESLGNYARAARKDKNKDPKPASAKHYDNDNLPANDKLSVVGNAPADPADKSAAPAQVSDPNAAVASNAAPDAAGKQSDTSSSDDKKKALNQWKDKLGKQKEQIDLAARELDVMQREYRLRAAAFYSDAGNRLRSPGGWDQEDGKYKQQIDEKQKALDSAKQKLSDMQEDARKSGVPSSARE